MSWQTVVNTFAVIGALSTAVTVAVIAVGMVLTRNADGLNRHSEPRPH